MYDHLKIWLLTCSISGFLPTANGGVAGLNNTTATGNPGVNNDLANQGYNVGSIWINVSTDKVFICVDAWPASLSDASPSAL